MANVEPLAVNFLNEEHFAVILAPDTSAERRDTFAEFLIANLRNVRCANASYTEIVFIDTNSHAAFSTEQQRVGTSKLGDEWFPAVRTAGNGTVTADAMQHQDHGSVEMWFAHALHEVDLKRNVEMSRVNGAVVTRVILEDSVFAAGGMLAWRYRQLDAV